jgi:hypothetical protein
MGDPEKAESAAISYKYWKKAESETRYASPKNGVERQIRMKRPVHCLRASELVALFVYLRASVIMLLS